MSGSFPVACAWNCAMQKGYDSRPLKPDVSVTRHIITVMLSLREVIISRQPPASRKVHTSPFSLTCAQPSPQCGFTLWRFPPLSHLTSHLAIAASCHLRVLGLLLKPHGKGTHVSIGHFSYGCGTFLFGPGGFANKFYGGKSSKRQRDHFRIATMKVVSWEPCSTQPWRVEAGRGGIRWLVGTQLQNRVHSVCCLSVVIFENPLLNSTEPPAFSLLLCEDLWLNTNRTILIFSKWTFSISWKSNPRDLSCNHPCIVWFSQWV